MEDTYYARSANTQGEKETVPHHLNRAAELCQEFLAPLGYEVWGEVLGKFHDFGKYSDQFQQVLRREKTHVNMQALERHLFFKLMEACLFRVRSKNRGQDFWLR